MGLKLDSHEKWRRLESRDFVANGLFDHLATVGRDVEAGVGVAAPKSLRDEQFDSSHETRYPPACLCFYQCPEPISNGCDALHGSIT